MHVARVIFVFCSFFVIGCAHLDFGKDASGKERGLTFFEPVPYLFVSTTKECVTTATVTVIPGERRELKFEGGYGSHDLSASLVNGMLSSVGQKADSKIPETLSAVGSIAGAMNPMFNGKKSDGCQASATLYPVNARGEPDITKPIPFPVHHIGAVR